jgi:hypothetical protein
MIKIVLNPRHSEPAVIERENDLREASIKTARKKAVSIEPGR